MALNWDFLVEDGLAVLAIVSILTIGTLVFYFLTGATDPGYVRNQIFENQYETTEFFEDEEQNGPYNPGGSSNKNSSAKKQAIEAKKRSKSRHARIPSTVLAELDKE